MIPMKINGGPIELPYLASCILTAMVEDVNFECKFYRKKRNGNGKHIWSTVANLKDTAADFSRLSGMPVALLSRGC